MFPSLGTVFMPFSSRFYTISKPRDIVYKEGIGACNTALHTFKTNQEKSH